MWNYGTIPFVILAILVATSPVYYMTWHSFRHGHVASHPDNARVPAHWQIRKYGWAVCSHCSAVVVDQVTHGLAMNHFAKPDQAASLHSADLT
jgi:hypothetical protein